jgi:uncharacterized protein YkwD
MRGVALLIIAACGTSPRTVGSQPSWRHGEPSATRTAPQTGPITFAPAAEPARSYNEPVRAPPHTALGDAVTAAVRGAADRSHLPAPVADARLFRACDELAQIVPEDGVVDYSLIEFALQHNGIIEPSPHVLVVWGDVEASRDVLGQLEPQLADLKADGVNLRFGIGAAKRKGDGTGVVVFAVQGSGITTTPIPRELAAGASATLDAVVDARYHDPEVFVTHDDGATERLALEAGRAGAFKAPIGCGKHRGRQQIEITASDTQGSTVLANFPVWCGADPPLSIVVSSLHEPEGVLTSDEAEHRLLAMMNRDRQAAGLPALLWDDRVAAVARGYSEEMRRTKVVAHISPTSGSAADRVRAANIKTAVVLENVARAYGIVEAHEGLMNSPGHRANLMSALATHVGIGVVYGEEVSGRPELYVTQVFIRIPPKVDAARAAELVRQRIDGVRHVAVDAQLASVAQGLADGLAAGKTRDELWPAARKRLDAMAGQYARVGSVVTAVADVENVDGKELIGESKPDNIGVGIAQGNHPEIGEGAVWIVILMAERPRK